MFIDPNTIFEKYGVWALLAYMVLKDAVPFALNKLFPFYFVRAQKGDEQRAKLEERAVAAQEKSAEAMQQLSTLSALMNNQIGVMAAGVVRVENTVTGIDTRIQAHDAERHTVRTRGSRA